MQRPNTVLILTDVLTDEATQFIRRHRGEPFFLYLAHNAPHYPFQSLDDDLAPFRSSGKFTEAVSHIYGMIRCMDRGVARVIDTLEREGLAENTLLLFSSDNGPQFGGKGEMCSDRFNCGFAGAKTLVYEGGIRLPMVLRWPAGFAGQRRLDEMIHFTDWLPTFLAAAGAEPPPALHLDGVDVLPLLRGENDRVPEQRFWQWNRYAPVGECNAAMRDGRWKLVRPAVGALMAVSTEDFAIDVAAKYEPETYTEIIRTPVAAPVEVTIPPAQLFDIEVDPGETRDLAAAEPARVARMELDLARWFEQVIGNED